MKRVYFIGIGGIGMSALARYFLHEGYSVGGYDRTQTPLTEELEALGAQIHYVDSVELIGEEFKSAEDTIVVYTPAVPASHSEFLYFQNNGFQIVKRSQMLGHLSEGKYVMAVAGTHGKTSTGSLLGWLNHSITGGGSAFLGGIARNFDSNMILGEGERLVVEADEFDRSFLQLKPDVAIITSVDADHLDIYGTYESVKEAFSQFTALIKKGGSLIIRQDVEIDLPQDALYIYRYSYNKECDFYAINIELQGDGHYTFDIVMPDHVVANCRLGVAGRVNIENCVAAAAAMWCAARTTGEVLNDDALRRAIAQFQGVKRRFEIYVNRPNALYIDDYAHHPAEIEATIKSIRDLFPDRRMLAIFQPHLFTRTRDNYIGFAESLSLADQVVLLPIYPAREEPIEGVTSEMIRERIPFDVDIVELGDLTKYIEAQQEDIVVSFGAGDISTLTAQIAQIVENK